MAKFIEPLEKLARHYDEVQLGTGSDAPRFLRVGVKREDGFKDDTTYIGPGRDLTKNLSWAINKKDEDSNLSELTIGNGSARFHLRFGNIYVLSSSGRDLPLGVDYTEVSVEEFSASVERYKKISQELDAHQEKIRKERRPEYPQPIFGRPRY